MAKKYVFTAARRKALAKARRAKFHGYSSKKSRKADLRQHAKNRPAKKYKKGIGNKGDW